MVRSLTSFPSNYFKRLIGIYERLTEKNANYIKYSFVVKKKKKNNFGLCVNTLHSNYQDGQILFIFCIKYIYTVIDQCVTH